ncbi:hypothetical protein BDD12DRAFT_810938 [Trichophaea hybrida]|nr:hypothetical protein BDD12DRAFT_810938 [Trichophaea hybrida]
MPPPPEKHVTLAYAATASLAAVTLVYVFGPTWFIDSAPASSKDRKKGVVGLANPANDCFVWSPTMRLGSALAGLEDLRAYLSQRTLVAKQRAESIGDDGLTLNRKPYLTAALKEILDSLNERPLYRKTISNRPFLIVLERVFRQRISRQQQDAHEFLQVVAETLAEEHRKQRMLEREQKPMVMKESIEDVLDDATSNFEEVVIVSAPDKEPPHGDETLEPEPPFVGMPLEGRLKSEIECQTCHFMPKPTTSTFVVLTLPVPQKSTTSLSECIDGALSTEYIDDFQCAKSRRIHTEPSNREELENSILKLSAALETDPETIPNGIELPSFNNIPKSRIAKRMLIEDYPDIIALHLSRSIYDIYASRKNGAKVSFSETLQMGGILDRRKYRLLCVVTHKGGHDSGHYECFRRQIVARPPFSTPSPTPVPSNPATPVMAPTPTNRSSIRLAEDSSRPLTGESFLSPSTIRTSASDTTSTSTTPPPPISLDIEPEIPRSTTPAPSENEKRLKVVTKKIKKKRENNKWWRISDDKIKEARTSDVLGMQKEVYLLFYQLDKGGE